MASNAGIKGPGLRPLEKSRGRKPYRQLGVTTYFSISFLDDCFWHGNTNAGIIAHRKEDAEDIFKKKVKYAYDRMPQWTRTFNSATNDRSGELAFANGSSYRVSTGFRSGTYQRLLVSEFGKICAKSPDVAKEIVTGSLNTVSADQVIAIESTAEGREGYFYNFAKESEALSLSGCKLSAMQQRFFFFPWYDDPGYRESGEAIIVSKETNEYLDKIEIERQRSIDEEQRRWYEMKLKMLGDAMKQEYPSTPKEAFESANEGLYYGTQLSKLRANGSVCKVAYDDSLAVHTAWDLGLDDFTSIWCFQVNRGGNVSIINYYENWDEGASHYCDWLNKQKYRFGRHIFPHDARKRDAGAKTQYLDYVTPILDGKFVILDIKECDKLEGIQTVRSMLSRCCFDEEKTAKGFRHLEAYKKLWDDRLGCYKNTPLHDEHSHACFIASTLITTDKGLKPIDSICIGDMVKTPIGFKKVLGKFQYETKSLLRVKTSNSEFFCTKNHKIFTKHVLKYADELCYHDELINDSLNGYDLCKKYIGCLGKKTDLGFRDIFLSMNQKQESCSTDGCIDGTVFIIQEVRNLVLNTVNCIGRYGHITMEEYQTNGMCTIRMETPEIIILKILKLSVRQITQKCICMSRFVKQSLKNLLKLPMNMLNCGMPAKREKSGIKYTQKTIGTNGKLNNIHVSYVLNQWNQNGLQNTVQEHVEQLQEEMQEKTILARYVRYVKKLILKTNTKNQELVLEVVPINLEQSQKVYDIEVEGDHCYYANGLLVSNSDAFRYLAVGLKGLERKDNSSADNDLRAVNRYYGI